VYAPIVQKEILGQTMARNTRNFTATPVPILTKTGPYGPFDAHVQKKRR